MKLTDLIAAIAEPGQLASLLARTGVNTESEHLSVYLHPALEVDADVRIFGLEETNEEYEYRWHERDYVQLLPLYMVVELVEDGLATRQYTHAQIADRLIEFGLNDA